MKFVYRLSFIVVGYLILMPIFAYAAGLAVSPEKLELTGLDNQKIVGEFEVVNIADQSMEYQVSTESTKQNIIFEPENFSLLAGDSRKVKVLAKLSKPGQLATTINILGKQITTSTLPGLAGIKLPILIKAEKNTAIPGWVWLLFFGGLVILCILSVFGIRHWHHRRRWWKHAFGKVDLLHHKKFF